MPARFGIRIIRIDARQLSQRDDTKDNPWHTQKQHAKFDETEYAEHHGRDRERIPLLHPLRVRLRSLLIAFAGSSKKRHGSIVRDYVNT